MFAASISGDVRPCPVIFEMTRLPSAFNICAFEKVIVSRVGLGVNSVKLKFDVVNFAETMEFVLIDGIVAVIVNYSSLGVYLMEPVLNSILLSTFIVLPADMRVPIL